MSSRERFGDGGRDCDSHILARTTRDPLAAAARQALHRQPMTASDWMVLAGVAAVCLALLAATVYGLYRALAWLLG